MDEVLLSFFKDIMMSSLDVGITCVVPPFDNLEELDQGIFKVLWNNFDYSNESLKSIFYSVEEDNIYYFKTAIEQNYILFKLPNSQDKRVLVIGPYLMEDASSVFYERIITKNRILDSSIQALKTYYTTVPVVSEITASKIANTVASYLYRNFKSENVVKCYLDEELEYQSKLPDTLSFTMKVLEERYKMENNVLEAIKKGDSELAVKHLSEFSRLKFPARVDNLIRNTKNYLFVMNTLYRKAAEAGNVHPVYLDQISSEFAVQIESINDILKLNNLVNIMTNQYCLLVKKYSLSQYSHLVRKTMNYIRLNLSSPLSLRVLADNFGINASYLSDQFKKETNLTITDYIQKERINAAIQFLNSTTLPMQEIAFRVGIEDYSYFSKLFKKHIGLSPIQYSKMKHEEI